MFHRWAARHWQVSPKLLAALVLACFVAAPLAAAEPARSLDEQLLDDLDSDLLPAAPKTKPAPPEKTAPRAPAPAPAGLDEELLDQLGVGEDIGGAAQPDPLTQIGRAMRQVETLIARSDTSSQTQKLQRQIVVDLEALLEQTQKQCQGGQCKPSPGAPKPSGSPSGQQPNEGEASQKPARDSTERLAQAGQTDAQREEDLDALVKEVWGHLPEKVRGQLQNVTVENFLPKYEKLIEEYYRRLAEEPAR